MPCPFYSLVTFPLAKKPPRAAPSALQPPAPCTSQEPQAPLSPWEGRKAQPPPCSLKSSSVLDALPCPSTARALLGGCSTGHPWPPWLLIMGIKSPAKDNFSRGGMLLQQLLTGLMGNFLWERGSIQNRVRGELPWKLGPFLLRSYNFPRNVPDRIYLRADCGKETPAICKADA